MTQTLRSRQHTVMPALGQQTSWQDRYALDGFTEWQENCSQTSIWTQNQTSQVVSSCLQLHVASIVHMSIQHVWVPSVGLKLHVSAKATLQRQPLKCHICLGSSPMKMTVKL